MVSEMSIDRVDHNEAAALLLYDALLLEADLYAVVQSLQSRVQQAEHPARQAQKVTALAAYWAAVALTDGLGSLPGVQTPMAAGREATYLQIALDALLLFRAYQAPGAFGG